VDYSWVFAKSDARIVIRRSASIDTTQLVTEGDAGERILDFKSHAELVEFQIRMEEHLIRSGWAFVGFWPERRTPGEAGRPMYVPDRRTALRHLRE
jgi:hypothetical protein